MGVAWRWRGGLEIGVGSGLAVWHWSLGQWTIGPRLRLPSALDVRCRRLGGQLWLDYMGSSKEKGSLLGWAVCGLLKDPGP